MACQQQYGIAQETKYFPGSSLTKKVETGGWSKDMEGHRVASEGSSAGGKGGRAESGRAAPLSLH